MQRLNVAATWLGGEQEEDRGERRSRGVFVQENADLVSQIMALRVELTMRVVMPAVVPHSQRYPSGMIRRPLASVAYRARSSAVAAAAVRASRSGSLRSPKAPRQLFTRSPTR